MINLIDNKTIFNYFKDFNLLDSNYLETNKNILNNIVENINKKIIDKKDFLKIYGNSIKLENIDLFNNNKLNFEIYGNIQKSKNYNIYMNMIYLLLIIINYNNNLTNNNINITFFKNKFFINNDACNLFYKNLDIRYIPYMTYFYALGKILNLIKYYFKINFKINNTQHNYINYNHMNKFNNDIKIIYNQSYIDSKYFNFSFHTIKKKN